MKEYHQSVETVLRETESRENGLSNEQVEEKRLRFGLNKLEEAKRTSLWMRLLGQLADPMILILLAAATISGIVGEVADTIIIMVVVVLNSVLGVVQEGKAEKAIEALQKMSSPYSKVRRCGHVMSVKSEELVPGDIVLLESGDAVPADLRVIEASALKVEEASLTGESVPIEKHTEAMEGSETDVPLGDRRNMVYMGTNIVYGRGEGVATATGMQTEMGKIAGIIARTDNEKTPLQKKLAGLSKVLSIGVLLICVFIFVFGVIENGGFTGSHVLEMFLIAISLAVAAIPEGLVAVVTIVLSIGVTKMSKRNAIIRRLTAVETLGCTEVICSDKTGTLTQNKMTVVDSYGMQEPLMVAMSLCNDAQMDPTGEILGDPTENALIAFALKNGLNQLDLEERLPRVAEAPFDSDRKMMSTVHEQKDGGYVQYTKGAPEVVVRFCTHVLTEEGIQPLNHERRVELMGQNLRMTRKALRVLAAAMRTYDIMPEDTSARALEQSMIFIGLAGMIDPVRPEVKGAIKECRDAQIRPIMITGDHLFTAIAIARELEIIDDDSQAISGSDLEVIPDSEFEQTVGKYSVYARVQPEHKVRIVEMWKKQQKVTAMTGDGVNDAPALKTANIGIGMGITGTDVTKNVSDMVLADDNFATIVDAVEEGRRIYDNILKAIQFLLSSNLSEVVTLFFATMMNFVLFTPAQLLWINLVTDSFPAIALGMEGAEPDIMSKPPRKENEGVFANGLGIGVIYQGLVTTFLTLFAYFVGCGFTFSAPTELIHMTGMTMAFVTLSMAEIFHSLNMRSVKHSIFSLPTQNKFLLGAMVLSFTLTMFVVYTPVINAAFEMVALTVGELTIALALALAIIPVVEIVKLFTRSSEQKKENIV